MGETATVVQLLLEHGAQVDKKVVAHAASIGNATALREIVQLPEFSTEMLRIGLVEACKHGRLEVLQLLVMMPDASGEQALVAAVGANQISAAKFLLKHFPNLQLDFETSEGDTALMVAAAKGSEAIPLLLDNKANVNFETSL